MFNLDYEPKNAVVRFLRDLAIFVSCQIYLWSCLAIGLLNKKQRELFFAMKL